MRTRFSLLSVLLVAAPFLFAGEAADTVPQAIATMRSIGLYWKPTGGSTENICKVRYRSENEAEWKDGLDLWFDGNEHKGAKENRHQYKANAHTKGAVENENQYRGSLVHLTPGTMYEIELSIPKLNLKQLIRQRTMPETFKIARTVTLPEDPGQTYVITEGGNAQDGYVRYAPADGAQTVWDGKDTVAVQIRVEAPHVMISGITLKNARNHGIELMNVHNVVIENCDISGWGQNDKRDGYGVNFQSAIFSRAPDLQTVIIRNNRLHHPRSDSNSWREKTHNGSSHPRGAQGITFLLGKGHYIIYNNRIYSDLNHMFNDAMGGSRNFSYDGFPNRDSDIYANFVSHCWDDGLEIEGADMNVRVWDNYIDLTWGALGAATPSLGPVYFWRNVYATSRAGITTDASGYRGHYTFKLGNENLEFVRGKMYLFHNTALQTAPYAGHSAPSGAQSGIVFTSDRKLAHNITSRNNILHLRLNGEWVVRDTQLTKSNDFDYDMHNGKVKARKGSEKNAILAEPEYERSPDGLLWLKAGTPGHDAALRIPNFNDDFQGKAPDMGAIETGSTRTKPITWPDFPQTYKAVDKDVITNTNGSDDSVTK